MMRKSGLLSFFSLGFFLFCWINLPKTFSDQARNFTTASLRPWVESPLAYTSSTEIAHLRIENQTLRAQIDHVYGWLLFDQGVTDQIELFKNLVREQASSIEGPSPAFLHRRASQLGSVLQSQLFAVPSKVIYRDPGSWSSSLWINVGDDDNSAFGQVIIAKNSPVVSGNALVGVVDHVGKKQSRVRLITDSALCPSVRAVRGSIQNRDLVQQIQSLLSALEKREDLFASSEEKKDLVNRLISLKEQTGIAWNDLYLAKGEVHGSSTSFWRSRSPLLKGIGFNFDYPDEEGSSRELKGGNVPILKEGDLLLTSGLDGVFPPGLRVGTVTQVDPLKEGSYAYNIEVKPYANSLNDLEVVFVLPPLSE